MTDLEARVERIEDELGIGPGPDEPDRVAGRYDYGGREVVVGFDGTEDNPLHVYEDGEEVGFIFMNHLADHVRGDL